MKKTKYLEKVLLWVLALGVIMAPQTSQVNSYVNGQVLTADQLNAEFGNLYSTINGLDEDNFLSSTVFPATFLSPAAAGVGLAVDVPTGVMSVGVDNTGIEISADALRLKALGVTTAKLANGAVTTAKLDSAITVAGGDGAVGTPAFSFTSDTNTGMYSGGADVLSFATGGSNRLNVSATGMSIGLNGSAGTPAISFNGDTDSGIYRDAPNATTIAAGGVEVGNFTTSGLDVTALASGTNDFIKWTVFQGTLTSGSSLGLDAPSGTIIGVTGWTKSADNAKWHTLLPDGSVVSLAYSSDGDGIFINTTDGSNDSDTCVIKNFGAFSSTYKVLMFYF